MKTLHLSELNSEAIVAAAQAVNEPAWLIERRVQAWNFFAEAAPPEWRRTQLADLDAASLTIGLGVQGTALQWDETLAAKGVVFTTLAAALQTHNDLIRERIDTAVEPLIHKFSALRAALWQDGVLLYVPRNVDIELPLRVCYTLADDAQTIFPRTLVVLEANSRVTLIEEYTSRDRENQALAAPITEVFGGAGSELRFVSVQHWGNKVYHIGGQKLVLGRDAGAEWTSIALGGQVQHIEAESRLIGPGARVNWLGGTFASGEQNLVVAPWLRHAGDNCESYMEFRTVVNDKGYSVFDGMIKIERDTKATSTRLEEHALHLNPAARNDSIPGLMIDSNDVVKGGHASTSGDVDELQLFYMQARGIDKAEAKRMIVMGWLEAALERVPVEELRDELTETIAAKI
jgi:Fe-S cluster assembly protein SufD